MGGRSRVFRMPVPGGNSPPGARAAAGSRSTGSPGPEAKGRIVAGFLAPHPPHLIYAENPPQNEPRSRGGWDVLRWGYETARQRIREVYRPDVIVIHAPHWITMVGHHVNCVPNPSGVSVDPIFPHLFRYHFDFRVDVDLAEAVVEQGEALGLAMSAMRNPGMRVDYATIAAAHLLNPDWDIPIVSISANNNPYFHTEAPLDEMERLGEATCRAIEATGRRAVLAASNSLSHYHWDEEPDDPEDMAAEHPFSDHQYRWDMKFLELVQSGHMRTLRSFIPEHIAATASEIKAGGLNWMLAAMGWPERSGRLHAYGSVIGTGNAIVEWPGEDAAAKGRDEERRDV